jgi:hypothetical protein
MFTEDVYKEYFVEFHRKKKEMLILTHHKLKGISDERVRKALQWYMKREVRHAIMARDMARKLD